MIKNYFNKSFASNIKFLGRKIVLIDIFFAAISFSMLFKVHWCLLIPNLLDRPHIYQDVILSIFPSLVDMSAVLQLGDMPLWNWHVYSGMYEGSIFYNHVLYPLTLPFSLGWLLPSNPAVFHAYLIAHLAIGGVGMYWLARILDESRKRSQVHYIPVVKQSYYQGMGYRIDQYPSTNQYYQNTLSIPLFYGLSNADQKLVVSSIKELPNK